MCELSIWSDPMTGYLICARLNVILGILAVVAGKNRLAAVAWPVVGLGWIMQSFFFLWAFGLTSLSGIAPNFTFAGLILCLWQLFCLKTDLGRLSLRLRASGVFLVLLALLSMVPEEFRHDTFMMSYLYAKAFFLSRPLSLGLTLFALGSAPDILWGKGSFKSLATAEAKQTAMLAALIFLGGEIAGCYWGFMGWGTTWRWSGNFLFSAMVFVLFMVALHVPRSVFTSAKAQAFALFLPLALVASGMIYSKVVQI